jgi:putative ABC transport system permease protein
MRSDVLRLAARTLLRDWRGGELRILALSLVVAVSAVTAVAFFTDRIDRAMSLQAAELIAADLVLETSDPPRDRIVDEARRRGLELARTVTFPSVVLSGARTQLVQVKAVDRHYPLRGRLRVAGARNEVAVDTHEVPASRHAWVDPELLLRLGLRVGDRVHLGNASFQIAQVIHYEPDRGGELFRLSPRVMINLADLRATGLVSANSRISYNTLIAGASQAIASFRGWLEPRRLPGEDVQGVRDGRPEMRAALDRANRYLGLAALVAVVVAGAAIALASRDYAARQADTSAIMRCLGATQRLVLQVYAARLLVLGLVATVVGCALGYLAQTALTELLEGWLVQQVPPPGPRPIATGLATGLLALLGFALPPVLRLKQVSPLRVLRHDLGSPTPAATMTAVFAFTALCVLLALQAQDTILAGKLLLGASVTVAGLWLASSAIIFGIRHLPVRSGAVWRNAIARLAQRSGGSILQISALAIGIAALMVLAIARVDLLDIWRATLPPHAPNHFMINIQRPELDALERLFRNYNLVIPRFFPMVRGRLVAIDGRAVGPEDYDDPRARQLIDREFNLSWSSTLQGDNKIVAGKWWGRADRAIEAFSVEAEIADTLGIALGDRLRYRIAGETIEAKVTNLRQVEWDSFNVNFFVIATPALLKAYPASLITAFYLPPGRERFITALARQFPSITVLNVAAIMRQVRTIMDRAALAVEYVFLFTLAAGLLVMYAAIQSTQRERRREAALLRALGASRRHVLKGLLVEFGAIGMAAGLLAATAASLAGYLLATQIFELPYRINPWIWFYGIAGSTVAIAIAGLLGTRKLLNQSPLLVLGRT